MVDIPDEVLAGGCVGPEDVAGAVLVEILDAADYPAGSGARQDGAAVNIVVLHEPDYVLAAGIVQEDVLRAVVVKVADPADIPPVRHRRQVDTAHLPAALDEPQQILAATVAPQDAGVAGAIEIAGSGDIPVRRTRWQRRCDSPKSERFHALDVHGRELAEIANDLVERIVRRTIRRRVRSRASKITWI